MPDVDCPLDLFFGSGLGEAPVRALLFELVPGGAYRCWWPMPYTSSAVLRVRNASQAAVGLRVRVDHVPVPYGGRFGTFRAQVREFVPPPIAQWLELRDAPLYSAHGHGKLVGLAMVVGSDGLPLRFVNLGVVAADGTPLPYHWIYARPQGTSITITDMWSSGALDLSEGEGRLQGLPAGRHTLRLSHGGTALETPLEVPESGVVAREVRLGSR